MDQELKQFMTAMYQSLNEIRDSFVITIQQESESQSGDSDLHDTQEEAKEAQEQTAETTTKSTNVLVNIAEVLKQQFDFFKAAAAEAEFESDIAARRAEAEAAAGAPGMDAKPEREPRERKGLLGNIGKLFGAAGGILGGALAGGGILAAGLALLLFSGGMLIDKIQNMDAEAIKQNVLTLLSIADSFEGGSWEFLGRGGAFFLAMTGLGLGLAAFALGSGVAAAVDYFTRNSDFAENIKEQVITLLSIADEVGGTARFLADGAVFTLAMTGLGIGLAAFAIGSGVMAAVDLFSSRNPWAERVKESVVTLLSIKDEVGGTLRLLADGAVFTVAMTGIGIGLAAFALGSGVAAAVDLFSSRNPWAERVKDSVVTLLSIKDEVGGTLRLLADGAVFTMAMVGISVGLIAFALASGIESAIDLFREDNWAENIKDSVVTLLSISDDLGGNLSMLVDGAVFTAAMGGIALGLTAFSMAQGINTAVNMFADDEWAENIKNSVVTLLTIEDSLGENMLLGSGKFAIAMAALSAGILAFTGGQTIANLGSMFGEFVSDTPFSERIANHVTTLMNVMQDEDGNVMQEKFRGFRQAMVDMGLGLAAFAGGEFVGSLASIGTEILGFFGVESPFEKMLAIAENADELQVGADALTAITNAFTAMSGGDLSGMGEFARNLRSISGEIGGAFDEILGGNTNRAEIRLELFRELVGLMQNQGLVGTISRTGVPEASSTMTIDRMAAEAASHSSAGVMANLTTASNIQNSFNTNQLFVTDPASAEVTITRLLETER